MPITYLDAAPRKVRFFEPVEPVSADPTDALTEAQVDHVAEIFNTPLTGTYNWDYRVADDRINKLYELGKQLNWNASLDVHWDATPDWHQAPPLPEARRQEMIEMSPWNGYAPWDSMSDDRKIEFCRHDQAWSLSQFLHGEQGALLVASQLVSCAPSLQREAVCGIADVRRGASRRGVQPLSAAQMGIMYPMSRNLKLLIDKILTDPRWDLKFIGMQIIIEGLALAAFNTAKMTTHDPLLKNLVHYVMRDEARHVTFGVNYLEEFVKTLSASDVEDRAQFAYEACVVMRDRLAATEIFEHFGWDVEQARERLLKSLSGNSESRRTFAQLLFGRVIPNLKRIGLLTDRVRPKFEEMGVMNFEHLATDGDIDWRELEKPLEYDQTAA